MRHLRISFIESVLENLRPAGRTVWSVACGRRKGASRRCPSTKTKRGAPKAVGAGTGMAMGQQSAFRIRLGEAEDSRSARPEHTPARPRVGPQAHAQSSNPHS